MVNLANCSKERISGLISEIVLKYHVTPREYRHISKRVREKCRLQIPKVPKKLPDFLNSAEIYQLLKVSEDNVFDNLIIEFMIFTGLRLAETRDLMIEYIDFTNNQLKVVRGKGGKDRYIPISGNLQSKIRLFLNGRKKGFVFARRDEKKYTTRALRYKITKQIKKCGFSKHLYPHSLRHSFACLCLARGMRLEDIKLLMGHSHVATTEIYAKLELGSIKEQFLSLMDQRG